MHRQMPSGAISENARHACLRDIHNIHRNTDTDRWVGLTEAGRPCWSPAMEEGCITRGWLHPWWRHSECTAAFWKTERPRLEHNLTHQEIANPGY
ncbi:hypothetical protein I7I48_01242 [Histoplasma ohiense]|nr:hypothetical protein I7I48_01242 [Histoplasma ohiense (nom. inval.)]